MVYLFFIQSNKISIFWLTTDNFHFQNVSSGALFFFFFFYYYYQWLFKRTAQTVTLLEKSGIVWSHAGLETFQRKCWSFLARTNRCVLHIQNRHRLNQNELYWITAFKPLMFVLVFVLKWSFGCFNGRFCLCTQPSLRESSRPPSSLLDLCNGVTVTLIKSLLLI